MQTVTNSITARYWPIINDVLTTLKVWLHFKSLARPGADNRYLSRICLQSLRSPNIRYLFSKDRENSHVCRNFLEHCAQRRSLREWHGGSEQGAPFTRGLWARRRGHQTKPTQAPQCPPSKRRQP